MPSVVDDDTNDDDDAAAVAAAAAATPLANFNSALPFSSIDCRCCINGDSVCLMAFAVLRPLAVGTPCAADVPTAGEPTAV